MIELKSKLKRWGNSFGIVVPQKAVKDEKIKEGDEVRVLINIKKESNALTEVFGVLKGWEIDTQKFKNEMRKEEEEASKRKWRR